MTDCCVYLCQCLVGVYVMVVCILYPSFEWPSWFFSPIRNEQCRGGGRQLGRRSMSVRGMPKSVGGFWFVWLLAI